MKKFLAIVPRWLPALLIMLVIFNFSSQADGTLPDFQRSDYFVKKSAHVVVYGMLALSYFHALPKRGYKLAWLLALIFAATDEFHQSFVPGRTPSIIDVLVFDNLGALIALFLHHRFYGAFHE
jgi:VanZ family protein